MLPLIVKMKGGLGGIEWLIEHLCTFTEIQLVWVLWLKYQNVNRNIVVYQSLRCFKGQVNSLRPRTLRALCPVLHPVQRRLPAHCQKPAPDVVLRRREKTARAAFRVQFLPSPAHWRFHFIFHKLLGLLVIQSSEILNILVKQFSKLMIKPYIWNSVSWIKWMSVSR